MKGHTHEDCDQLFSRFGVKLGTNDVVTVDGMLITFFGVYATKFQCSTCGMVEHGK
jgi:hypothetical protein